MPAQAKRLVKNSIISIEAPEVELPEEDEFDEVAAATADVEAFRAAEGAPSDGAAEEPAAAPGERSDRPLLLFDRQGCMAPSLRCTRFQELSWRTAGGGRMQT